MGDYLHQQYDKEPSPKLSWWEEFKINLLVIWYKFTRRI